MGEYLSEITEWDLRAGWGSEYGRGDEEDSNWGAWMIGIRREGDSARIMMRRTDRQFD